MWNHKQCTREPCSGELTVEAAMGAKISDEDENGEYALTVACQALQPSRGGRGECGVAVGNMEAAMVWWSEIEAMAELLGAHCFRGESECRRWRVSEGVCVSGNEAQGSQISRASMWRRWPITG